MPANYDGDDDHSEEEQHPSLGHKQLETWNEWRCVGWQWSCCPIKRGPTLATFNSLYCL